MFLFRNKKDWLLFGIIFFLTGIFLFLLQNSFQKKNFSLDSLPLEARRVVVVKNPTLFLLVQELSSSNLVLKKVEEDNFSLNFNLGRQPVFLALNDDDFRSFQQLKEKFPDKDLDEAQIINLAQEISDSDYQAKDFFWVSPQALEKIISFLARLFGQLDPINRTFYLDQAYEKIVSLRKISQWLEGNRFSFPQKFFLLTDKRWVNFLEEIGFKVSDSFEIKTSSQNETFEELAKKVEGKKNSFILVNSDFPAQEFEFFLKEKKISARLIILDAAGEKGDSFEEILRKNLSQLNVFFN